MYPKDDIYSYLTNYRLPLRTLLKMGFIQKVLGVNRNIPWPVHFTSLVNGYEKIQRTAGHAALGFSPGCYIQGVNGIIIGKYVFTAPGVKIISANHRLDDLFQHEPEKPIRIEDSCWIGANAVILPGVHLGPSTMVGAGSVVTNSFPDGHCVIAGNPAREIKRI